MITLVLLAACGQRTTSDSTPPPAPPPLCEPVPAMTCADDALALEGCIGTTPPPSRYEAARRHCYSQSPDLRTACKQVIGRSCPTFLDYAVDSGMLDPTFESEEYVISYTHSSTFDRITAIHFEGAEDCTTSSGREFYRYGTRDLVNGLDNLTYNYVVSDVGSTVVFDELGQVEAIQRWGPTCCSGDGADEAWWGDPHHPMSPWCWGTENPACEPYECIELTPDDIRALVESQRR
ncbi:MAG: hypothetical protein H6738_18000 [Alphaproteobacteria bacterium]|nr:hypothetical protein [Alphaproteobacteria bacterium]